MSPSFLLWFLFAFLLTTSGGHVDGSRGSLSVPVGKSAFIQPDDVIIAASRDRRNVTSCVVEVVDDDVATLLRVGTVTPTVGYEERATENAGPDKCRTTKMTDQIATLEFATPEKLHFSSPAIWFITHYRGLAISSHCIYSANSTSPATAAQRWDKN